MITWLLMLRSLGVTKAGSYWRLLGAEDTIKSNRIFFGLFETAEARQKGTITFETGHQIKEPRRTFLRQDGEGNACTITVPLHVYVVHWPRSRMGAWIVTTTHNSRRYSREQFRWMHRRPRNKAPIKNGYVFWCPIVTAPLIDGSFGRWGAEFDRYAMGYIGGEVGGRRLYESGNQFNFFLTVSNNPASQVDIQTRFRGTIFHMATPCVEFRLSISWLTSSDSVGR